MEKEQIIELIKSNPQISYEEMKKQAIDAGVPEQLFSEAWNNVNTKPKNKKKWIIPIAIIVLLFGGWYYFTHFSSHIFEKEYNYEGGAVSAKECLEISKKYLDQWSSKYRIGSLYLKMEQDKPYPEIGKAETCRIFFGGKRNGTSMLSFYIYKNKIYIEYQDNAAAPDDTYETEGIPDIIDSTEILDYAKKDNEFKNDLKNLISQTGKTEKEIVVISGIFRKHQDEDNALRYSIKLDSNKIQYQFDAITGEKVSRWERQKIEIKEADEKNTTTEEMTKKTTKGINLDNINSWEELKNKLTDLGIDNYNHSNYLEKYSNTSLSAQDCLDLMNPRAKIWDNDSVLLELTLEPFLKTDDVSNGLSSSCKAFFQASSNTEALLLDIRPDAIQYSIYPDSPIIKSILSELSAPKQIYDSDEIISNIDTSKKISKFWLIYDYDESKKYVWKIYFEGENEPIVKNAIPNE